jgi:esterase/lipase
MIFAAVKQNAYKILFPTNKFYKSNYFYKEIFLDTKQGKMVSWYKEGDKNKPTILYFHGNGETIATTLWVLNEFIDNGYAVMLAEYPQYAINEGTINEENIIEVAKANYDFLKKKGYEKFAFYGFSIGTGVATKLATIVKPDFLILEAPFDSASGLAKHWNFGLITQKAIDGVFDNEKNLQSLPDISLLIIHGTLDGVVPYSMGEKLYNVAKTTRKKIYSINGAKHNNLKINGGIKEALKWMIE